MAMRITVLCVGKVKEKYLRDAIAEYIKRLDRYCKLSFIEVDDEKTPDHSSEAEKNEIKRKEAQRLLSKIKADSYVIALAIEGREVDSVDFSKVIEKSAVSGISQIVFVIGGSLGLCDSVLSRADLKISFSKLTFPHQLMRVILLEQIYRSFRILKNEPYHK